MRSDDRDSFSATDTDDRPGLTAEPIPPIVSPEPAAATPDIVEEVLIEEVSIDGMCGVY